LGQKILKVLSGFFVLLWHIFDKIIYVYLVAYSFFFLNLFSKRLILKYTINYDFSNEIHFFLKPQKRTGLLGTLFKTQYCAILIPYSLKTGIAIRIQIKFSFFWYFYILKKGLS